MLEEFYLLQKNINLSYTELKTMPVRIRRWYLERLVKEAESISARAPKNQVELKPPPKFLRSKTKKF